MCSGQGGVEDGDVWGGEAVEVVDGLVEAPLEGGGVGGGVGLHGGLDLLGEGGEALPCRLGGGRDGGVLHEDGTELHVAAAEWIVEAGHGKAKVEVQQLRVQQRQQVAVAAGNQEAFVVGQTTFPVEQRPQFPSDLGIDDLGLVEGMVVGARA